MKTQISILILAVALLLTVAAGCRRADDEGLLAVERAMDSDPYPARALAMLDSIEAAGQAPDRAVHAHRALLRAELTIKNHLPLTSDSLLAEARSYYTAHPRSNRLARAWHYTGIWHYINGDYDNAVIASTEAMRLATEIHDTLLIARSHEQLGALYNTKCNRVSEIEHRRIAADLYKKLGHNVNYLYSLIEIADAHAAAADYKTCLALLDSIAADVATVSNEDFRSYFRESYMLPYYFLDDTEGLDSVLSIQPPMSPDFVPMHHAAKAKIAISRKDFVSAWQQLDSMWPTLISVSDTLMYHTVKMDLLWGLGDYRQAFYSSVSAHSIDRRATTEALATTIDRLQSEYLDEKVEATRREVRLRRMQALLIATIAVLLLLGLIASLIIYFRHRIRAREELQAKIDEFNEQSRVAMGEIQTLSSARDNLSLLLGRILQQRLKAVERLIKIYDESCAHGKTQTQISEQLKGEAEKIVSAEEVSLLYEAIDRKTGGLVTSFRSSFPDAPEESVMLYALVCTSLSVTAMSLLLGISVRNLYTRRRRLRLMIENSQFINKATLLSVF